MMAGASAARYIRSLPDGVDIRQAELQVFSQFGEDGILQYLVHKAGPLPRVFVELGVQDYREANTRFLLMHDNWQGLIVDASHEGIEAVRRDAISWRHSLIAVEAFVDAANASGLIEAHTPADEVGVLSIDLDGNDYWVWRSLERIQPVIVIVEYNAVFGARHAITVPYDPAFSRTAAHFSNLYFGASLRALAQLADAKGYGLVGCTSAGNNAFFVRRDRMAALRQVTPEAAFVESRFRESRDPEGRLTYLAGSDRIQVILDLPVHDVATDTVVRLRDLAGGV